MSSKKPQAQPDTESTTNTAEPDTTGPVDDARTEERIATLEERLSAIEERLLGMEDRLFELPTRRDLEELVAGTRLGTGDPSRKLDRSEIPEVIRVRTKDGRRRHPRSGRTFGREWTRCTTADLTDEQLKAIANDPVLEVADVSDSDT